MAIKLIADSGATKCEWCLIQPRKKTVFTTQGLSPYFLSKGTMIKIIQTEVLPHLKQAQAIDEIYFYGTGLSNINHVKMMRAVLKTLFKQAAIEINTDILAAARALCGHEKGIACILGTGSNSCYFNGKKIIKNSPGIGYILGDEGSGAYLGKKVIQYYLYQTFDADLMDRFNQKYALTPKEILENVYQQPLANRYLAGFALFLAENRGHYMIENIIEDGLNDFFYQHLLKYKEIWEYPINFIGSVAFGFSDILQELCQVYEIQIGKILQKPMQGLIEYHR
ncbi:MAG: N-acetylglucosamine kinase [Sphingobacteriales bacterium]|uniref:N-acetylglucosamine kinase n=2 Tax=Hydrotalea TaxID=1004300 RepID=UPI000AF61A34|nr:N-acetylglucosamine kinase [Hydrotalea flava]RTL53267.1 MAG: N-acetylglucosamine kinase [Sphingobacteriales bacterium]